MSRVQSTRTQTPNLEGEYEAYLASAREPYTESSNPLNLFDAKNDEDKAWFRLTKSFIAHKKNTIYERN